MRKQVASIAQEIEYLRQQFKKRFEEQEAELKKIFEEQDAELKKTLEEQDTEIKTLIEEYKTKSNIPANSSSAFFQPQLHSKTTCRLL